MPLKLIYDISLLAGTYKHGVHQTGLYRYASELLKAYSNRKDLELSFAYTAYEKHFKHAKKMLSHYGLENNLCNKPAYPLPRNLMGRAERYFDKAYNLLKLDVNKILYDDEAYSRADVFHTPYPSITAESKKFSRLNRVITIHDLIPLLNDRGDEYARAGMKNLIHSIGDDYTICVSQSTRNDLLNYDKMIQPEKVFVSYLAADTKKFYPCSDPSRLSRVKQTYNLPDQYFLGLGTLEPRKNLSHLIKCFIRFIKEQHIKDLYLVLVGSAGWMFNDIAADINALHDYRDRIILTGRIPDEDLAAIYSQAHSFYFMSTAEGFGLPPLEAMQCGVPTVTSNVCSLPEVVGDGGIMLAPTDEDGLCNTMYLLYSDPALCEEYRIRALKKAREFSWDRCASEHIGIFLRKYLDER
jgi:glycosyltransferase involved in cell wall biosynthesis